MKKLFSSIVLVSLLISLVPSVQGMEAWTLRDELSYHEGGSEFVERVENILPQVSARSLM